LEADGLEAGGLGAVFFRRVILKLKYSHSR
jgi:hypothetical protein